MAQPTVKTSFASGEWAPKLRSRVDIQKYHAGTALLRNFYVDYSGGGASTRQGTKFCNQARLSTSRVRVIGFQPSTTVTYVLEFGNFYIRFFANGAPVLETAVTGGTGASGNTFTIPNSFAVGDWVFAQNWGGLTNVNGNYYIVAVGTTGAQVVVTDLFGNAVTFTGAYTSGGQLSRVYTLASPYAASDLFPNPITGNPGIKFVQDVTSLIICHPSYPPRILTIIAANNWTLSTISFGSTIPTPTGLTLTSTDGAGVIWYSAYLVTAVDVNGQESAPPTPATFAGTNPISLSTGVSYTLTWTAVSGAISYNVYKASQSYKSAVPAGAQFGFIGNVTSTTFIDSTPGIGADFSQTPPVAENPFQGAGVASYTVTGNGLYTTVPGVTIDAPPAGGSQATAVASLGAISAGVTGGGGSNSGWAVGDVASDLSGVGIVLKVATVDGVGNVTGATVVAPGSITSGTVPSNPINFQGVRNGSAMGTVGNFLARPTYGVTAVLPIQQGAGYTTIPNVVFSAGAAAATAVLGTGSSGNPGVPGFIQQRLALGAQTKAIQTFNLSQPGSFFNFNVSDPIQSDDAISAIIISENLNDIRSFTAVPTGLLALTGRTSWLINGGGGLSVNSPVTPADVTANVQSFNGANDMPPLKINYDLLYVTNKGNYVRDLNYNIYVGIFTGSDISVLSNHLFFNHYLVDWAWSEEPFKTAWVTRDDGILLSLGYVKEQELIGWAHHDTNGQFKSICSVYETVNGNVVDAIYVVVQRFINGQYVQYIERMADRFFPYGYEDSWSVDAALQTTPNTSPTSQLVFTGDGSAVGNSLTLTDTIGAPFTATMATNNWIVRAGGGIYKITARTSASIVTATVVRVPAQINPYTNTPYSITGYAIWQPVTTVTGLTQLVGQSVTGVADGAVVPTTIVSASGSVTLASAATKITLGLAFQPQLQTLPLDLGEPTVQGKRKKITALTLRVADTLGLSAGKTFSTLVPMKDFTIGNIPTTSTGVAAISDLVNGDGRTTIDQEWDTAGNYCVQQNLPYPATVLGVFPEVTVGDTPK